MKAAQDVHLPKQIIGGGGLREFILSEMNTFEGIEDCSNFFTMQERQALIMYVLNTRRVQNCDWLPDLVDGQPLSNVTYIIICVNTVINCVLYVQIQLQNVYQTE